MSVTRQKLDLRWAIHEVIEKYLEENPDNVYLVAMTAVRQLSSKMTLKELKEWHVRLSKVGVMTK